MCVGFPGFDGWNRYGDGYCGWIEDKNEIDRGICDYEMEDVDEFTECVPQPLVA